MTLDGRVKKVGEIVAEPTFGTFPSDPTMLGFGGYANPVSIKKSPTIEKIPYLKGEGDTNRLQATKTDKVSEAFGASVEVKVTDWSLLPFILGGGAIDTYAIGDSPLGISMGVIMDDQYEELTGGIFQKVEYNLEMDKSAVAKADMLFATSSGPSGTSYIGTGAHAAGPSGSTLKLNDVSGVVYDSASFASQGAHLESVKFGCEYSVEPVKDGGMSWESKIAGWKVGLRDINVELGLSLDDLTLAPDILDGNAHTFAMTLGGKTLTFSNMVYENEWEEKLDPEDVLGMDLKASNVDLVIS